MTKSITRTQSPEEEELERKRSELSLMESELVKRELELTTLQAELRAFELRYLRIVGVKYAELDRIEAQIAEILARIEPKNAPAQERAEQTRTRAEESARATGEAEADKSSDKFIPDEDLKKLFREAAKKVHPDLAADDKERARRTKVMAEINRAYQEGDATRLRALLDEWEGGPEAIKGDGIGAELVRIIRKISQIRKRLDTISLEISKLKESELAKLKLSVEEAEKQGRDLLQDMAKHVQEKIDEARKVVERLNNEFDSAREFLARN